MRSASQRRGPPLCHRLPVTNKPALNSFCRCMSREGDLPLLAAGLRASICSCAVQCVAIRHGFMPRDRSGFTSKTLPHVHQPYVVKVSPTPRHVLRRAATRDLAIPCLSWPRRVFQRDLTHLNSPQSSAGHDQTGTSSRAALRGQAWVSSSLLNVPLCAVSYRNSFAVGLRPRPSPISASPTW